MRKNHWPSVLPFVLLVVLTSCGRAPEVTPSGVPFVPGEVVPEGTPLAATVNGQPITLQTYERELARHRAGIAALGWETADDSTLQTQVLDLLIEYELILQKAQREGVSVTADQVETEVSAAIQASGSQQNFDAWLAANQWTIDEYRRQVLIELVTNQLVTQLLLALPAEAEQVHARHILVDSQEQAQSLLDQIANGADFTQLAADYSRDATTRYNGGDLGWFPRGVLLVSEVEDAAFSLQPGELSEVVASSQGYHIVQTLEIDPARPIPEETMSYLRENAIEEWRRGLWEGAQVERLVQPTS